MSVHSGSTAYLLEYADEKHAIRCAVEQSALEPKQIYTTLWPSLDVKSAAARWSGCLTPGSRYKLSPEEAREVQEMCRRWDLLMHWCDLAGLPRPVAPVEEVGAEGLSDDERAVAHAGRGLRHVVEDGQRFIAELQRAGYRFRWGDAGRVRVRRAPWPERWWMKLFGGGES